MKLKKSKKVVYANYDWDDNVFFMPTRIILFGKNSDVSPHEVAISTEVFAHIRSKVGVESLSLPCKISDGIAFSCESDAKDMDVNVLDYIIIGDSQKSFREFRDCDKKYFMRDLKKAISSQAFGPSYNDFVEHCQTQDSANHIHIITARGHAPETIHSGMLMMQEMGMINYVPPVENVFPVSYEKLESAYLGSANNPSDAKKNILLAVLDKVEELARGCSDFHTFGFSDDDKKNMDVIEKSLVEEINKGRWLSFEINLYYTGGNEKRRKVLLSPSTKAA